MSFLQLYNCLPDMPARLSKHLLDDWNRYNGFQLPQLRLEILLGRKSIDRSSLL